MKFKTSLRKKIIDISGYWIYKRKDLPIGCDLYEDLIRRLDINVNCIFDIGANVGQSALHYNTVFRDPLIYSFEPVLSSFEKLKGNTRKVNNVKCFQLALGDKEETKEIRIFEENMSTFNSLVEDSMNTSETSVTEKISITTGDKFCLKNNIERIDFLKIDAEGYEIPVLKGFDNMITNNRIMTIYCEVGFNRKNKRHTYFEIINQYLYEKNYSFYGLYDVSDSGIHNGTNLGNALYIHNSSIK
jgi:FkbM family methyltransferase